MVTTELHTKLAIGVVCGTVLHTEIEGVEQLYATYGMYKQAWAQTFSNLKCCTAKGVLGNNARNEGTP